MLKEQIAKLLKLQEVDLRIIGLQAEKKQLPEKIEEMRKQATQMDEQLRRTEDELKQVQVNRKEKELELQAKEAEIKKYQIQLYQVKTNKEYSSLQTQIEGLKADCSVLEEEIIAFLENIDKLNGRLKTEKEKHQEEQKQRTDKEASFNKRMQDVDEEVNTLEAERKKMSADVDKELYAKYEKVLRGKNAAALVPVVDDCCGGCHIELPPQVMADLSIAEKLILCENCARILYLPEGYQI